MLRKSSVRICRRNPASGLAVVLSTLLVCGWFASSGYAVGDTGRAQAVGNVAAGAKTEGSKQVSTYVGAKVCKSCHTEQYDGWKSTLHPYKFQDADAEAVIGDFQTNNTLTIGKAVTRMSRKGDDFFITTLGPDEREHTYKVKYLIGGFWKQQYVTEFPNGELHILPAMWIVKTQAWVKSKYWPKTIYQNSCSGCHNTGTQLNYSKATDTFQTTWADKGVGCESCHGPGSRHVSAGDSQYSSTIVNPAKIPDSRRAAMVCGSCHIRGKSVDGKYAYPVGYKPGGQLNFLFNAKPKLHLGAARAWGFAAVDRL